VLAVNLQRHRSLTLISDGDGILDDITVCCGLLFLALTCTCTFCAFVWIHRSFCRF